MTHALAYASEQLNDESHFNAYHSAIGDTSHQVLTLQTDTLSLGDIRFAMSLRYPDSISRDGHNYLSLQQKELVEFGYGQGSSKQSHCLGLLSPGEGKSEVYIIPTIARRLAHQKSKTIIHVSPYSFLAGYQFANANAVIKTLGFENSISTSLRGRANFYINFPQVCIYLLDTSGGVFCTSRGLSMYIGRDLSVMISTELVHRELRRLPVAISTIQIGAAFPDSQAQSLLLIYNKTLIPKLEIVVSCCMWYVSFHMLLSNILGILIISTTYVSDL
jgi:hypothetical protein